MKARITEKQAKYCCSFGFGYCEIQYLLRAYSPIFYTAWMYGRKADIYQVNGRYISTGYAPVGDRLDYSLVKKYETKAKKIWDNYDLPYDKRQKKVEKLLLELIPN